MVSETIPPARSIPVVGQTDGIYLNKTSVKFDMNVPSLKLNYNTVYEFQIVQILLGLPFSTRRSRGDDLV
jgi:hypothetical protein